MLGWVLVNNQRHQLSLRSKIVKVTIGVCATLVAIAAPLQLTTTAVHADQYDDQIRALQQQIDQFNAQANALNDQVSSLQSEVAGLDRQKTILQTQVDLQQAQYDKLQGQIQDTQQKIADNKKALGEVIADLYVSGSTTPLEMLASSNNVGEYMDKNTYRSSMSDTLQKTIESVKQLEQELEQQKTDVTHVLAGLSNTRNEIAQKEQEKATLLDQTQGQQDQYLQFAATREAQKLEVQKQQQAAIEAAIRAAGGRGSIILPGTTAYPWNSSNCYVDANAWSHGGADGNGTDGLGYGCRQCVSYVAWRVYKETGYAPIGWGNAYDWPASARAAGYQTSSVPREHSAGVIMSGGEPGHIVWVESVDQADGTMIVSQYNYYNAGGSGWGNYSKMQVPIGTYQSYIYF